MQLRVQIEGSNEELANAATVGKGARDARAITKDGSRHEREELPRAISSPTQTILFDEKVIQYSRE